APSHRLHQRAAREVLKALLPTDGLNLKGEMKSRAELLEVSSYAGRPGQFDQLMRILDGELRLITPTEAVPNDRQSVAAAVGSEQTLCYQLTHDYLVPALREWLTSCQKQTRRGRDSCRPRRTLTNRTAFGCGRRMRLRMNRGTRIASSFASR